MQLIDSEEKPQLTAEIDKCIFDWTNETNGVLIKSDRDKVINNLLKILKELWVNFETCQ